MRYISVIRIKLAAAALVLFTAGAFGQSGQNLYLVSGKGGPGFTSPQQAVEVLEKGILPTFEALKKLEAEGKIITGGLPVGQRAMVFIVKASSNGEVDQLLRGLPAWGVLQWEVTALESFEGRANQERANVEALKKSMK